MDNTLRIKDLKVKVFISFTNQICQEFSIPVIVRDDQTLHLDGSPIDFNRLKNHILDYSANFEGLYPADLYVVFNKF